MGRGFIARILEVRRVVRGGVSVVDVKCDPGGGANVTPEHIATPGDDSPPIPVVDRVAAFEVEGTGRAVGAGYVDTANPGTAEPGERRLLGRDSSGAIQATVHLKADGEVEIFNAAGSFVLSALGEITGQNLSGGFFKLDALGGFTFSNPNGNISLNSFGFLIGTVTGFAISDGSAVLSLASGLFSVNGATIPLTGDVVSSAGTGSKSLSGHTHAQGNDSDGDTEVETNPPS